MAIKAIVASLDTVEESLRSEYTPVEGGGYRLKALEGFVSEDAIETHEKTKGLKSALEKERAERRDYERKVKALEAGQITEEDRTELEALRQAKLKTEETRRRQEGEFDKWRADIADKHSKETQSLVSKLSRRDSMILDGEVFRQISDACNEFGGRASILTPLVQQSVRKAFAEDGERLEITVHDGEGTKILGDDGKPLSIKGFVKRMAENKEFADLFASKQKAGGGSDSNRDGGGGKANDGEKPDTKGLSRAKMSKLEKVEFIKKHGQVEFMKLPLI